MKRNVASVMKALEGEVELHHNHQRLAPFKHSLLSRERSIETINSLFDLLSLNSQLLINLDLNNLKTLFVPNLNIKELTIVDKEARERRIE
jgi:hypothetical protein